jgi:eight-cysteine-cluster-containing protein
MRFLVLLLIAACAAPQAKAPEPTVRIPAVPADSPHHDLFEGADLKNACSGDADCHIGGCSSEICSAEKEVTSACIVQADQPRGARCGCVSSTCIWYR